MTDTPTKCSHCGEVKALYKVDCPLMRGSIMLLVPSHPHWICLECWQQTASESGKPK